MGKCLKSNAKAGLSEEKRGESGGKEWGHGRAFLFVAAGSGIKILRGEDAAVWIAGYKNSWDLVPRGWQGCSGQPQKGGGKRADNGESGQRREKKQVPRTMGSFMRRI